MVPAPEPKETANSETPAPVASEPPASAAMAAAVPDSTEAAPSEPKKTPKKRSTARRDRSRDFLNPFRFFASGPFSGSRRSF
jgi:hypothetical protein